MAEDPLKAISLREQFLELGIRSTYAPQQRNRRF